MSQGELLTIVFIEVKTVNPARKSMLDKSGASFCHQVTALVPDMFCNFYFVINHKIADNSATMTQIKK
jgi:hypothetical protein